MDSPRPTGDVVIGSDAKPTDQQIDVYGLTHVGKVREVNQDHFLVCSLHKHMEVHLTSLPDLPSSPLLGERLAFLAMVADGVGGGPRGEEASRTAVENITRYVAECLHTYYTVDPTDESAFSNALQEAALKVHGELVERGRLDPERRNMATTLTLWIGVWPRAYLLQAGDSRYYMLRDGELTQVSRDQTIAQELLDQGVLTRTGRGELPWSHVLSSSIGGEQSSPVVTGIDQDWGVVHLLCSDGLTKHVSDERIRERLVDMTSTEQVCRDLLQDALDGGGSDNVTLIVGRALRDEDD